MSEWILDNYAAIMTGIVVMTIVLSIVWAKRLEKERGRIRDNVHKGGFISAEDFQRDWISMRANGRKGAAGYKYEDGPGCYVIESFPVGTENPDFEHPNEVYVGQSLHICNRVRNHLNGKGNGDVYADLGGTQAGTVEVAGTGDAASVSGPSDPAAATLAGTARFEWSFSKLNAEKNADVIGKAANGTAVLGSVTFTFAKDEPEAFAVYSADDGSLSFYKRADVPVADQMFEGKTATEVYTGLETMTSIPGWTQNHFNDIKTVMVYDKGIAPTGTAFWFAGVRNLKTADVSKLDMSRCKTIECMFTDCISLETLDLSGWDTSSLTSMSQAFHHCASLTKLNVSGWDVSKVTNMQLAFAEDKALGSLDLSTWDNSAVTSMKDAFSMMNSLSEVSLGSKFKFVGTSPFLPVQTGYVTGADGKWYDTDGNGYAPEDIPSNKAMTYTAIAPKKAFAVYSADDNSLNFYKRASVPSAGEQFEGKTATAVYTGIEDTNFSIKCVAGFRPGGFTDSTSWAIYKPSIKTATVVDEGIAPKSTSCWFSPAPYTTSALENCDLAKLNAASLTSMDDMFDLCYELQKVTFGENWKWIGANEIGAYVYLPKQNAAHIAGADGKWYAKSTGTGYTPESIPSLKADTYYASKALRDAAVGVASDPADDDAIAVPAAASTCKAQGESATQKAEEGVPSLEGKASEKSNVSTEHEGTGETGISKPETVSEATKEDVSAIVPEGAENAGAVKSGE